MATSSTTGWFLLTSFGKNNDFSLRIRYRVGFRHFCRRGRSPSCYFYLQVLLQGVVDCALLEEDGIMVLDFKTDHVTEETLPLLTERYRGQLRIYADALERIYKKKVKNACLYFFGLKRFAQV